MGSIPSAERRPERRDPQRYELRIPVDYQSSGRQGTGLLWDISTSGARIEQAPVSVQVGTEVTLLLAFLPGATPVSLRGEVVRQTKSGFAVKFLPLEGRVRLLLKVALPRAVAFAAKQ